MDIKNALLKLAEDDEAKKKQQLMDHLGLKPKFKFIDEDDGECGFELEHPENVPGMPACISKLNGEPLLLLYYVEFSHRFSRGRGGDPDDFEVDVDDQDIKVADPDEYDNGTLTPEDCRELESFITLKKCDEIEKGFIDSMTERQENKYAERHYEDARSGYDEDHDKYDD